MLSSVSVQREHLHTTLNKPFLSLSLSASGSVNTTTDGSKSYQVNVWRLLFFFWLIKVIFWYYVSWVFLKRSTYLNILPLTSIWSVTGHTKSEIEFVPKLKNYIDFTGTQWITMTHQLSKSIQSTHHVTLLLQKWIRKIWFYQLYNSSNTTDFIIRNQLLKHQQELNIERDSHPVLSLDASYSLALSGVKLLPSSLSTIIISSSSASD